MAKLPPREHRISLADAKAHTKRHRDGLGKGQRAEADHSGAFHADQVLQLLAQPGCAMLRIYHGRNEKGARSMVLVGVDENNNDLTQGIILEQCWPCPPFCPTDSALLKD